MFSFAPATGRSIFAATDKNWDYHDEGVRRIAEGYWLDQPLQPRFSYHLTRQTVVRDQRARVIVQLFEAMLDSHQRRAQPIPLVLRFSRGKDQLRHLFQIVAYAVDLADLMLADELPSVVDNARYYDATAVRSVVAPSPFGEVQERLFYIHGEKYTGA